MLLIAFVGSLSTFGGGGGESPAQPLELAILPDTAPAERRTDRFAVYGILARTGTAFGALAAGLPAMYQGFSGVSTLSSFKLMFVGFAVLQIVGAILYSLLSTKVESPGE